MEVFEEGDTLYLNCTHGGGPDNEYQWLINGVEVDNVTGPYLTTTLANENKGLYTCNVTNPAGTDSASIFITTKPVIQVSPEDTYSSIGEEVKFSCRASGFPTPNYIWTKTNGKLPDNSSISTNGDGLSTLTIFPVMLEDYGEYNCIANNSKSVQVSAHLTGMLFSHSTAFLFHCNACFFNFFKTLVTTPYIMLGVTEGVTTYSLSFNGNGLSLPISVMFPLGFQQEHYTYVCYTST